MMKLPAFLHHQFPTGETATVFQDDRQFWRFYIIPGFPTVRTDPNGNPVFQLIKYKLSDQSREENPDLARGGGFMVFDAELKLSGTQQQTLIDDHLKPYVNDRWQKLKNRKNKKVRELEFGATFQDTIGAHWAGTGHENTPRASSTQNPTATLRMPGSGWTPPTGEAPDVLIGEPLWKAGKVTMNTMTAEGLVTGTVGERKASLVGNNVAAFSVDLTEDGASIMQQVLVGDGGGGATDIVPIQVAYELTMAAKLPPARMWVKFNTASVYHAVQELFHEHNNCSDDYFTSETMMTSAIEAGLIKVKIDMGGITDDDLEQMMMQQAMNTVNQLLTERFAKKERAPLEEWADEDLAESSREVYRLKQVSEIDMTDFQQTMSISSAIDYTIAPQATLQAFFKDISDMSPFVREVDANDPFFMTLGLKGRAFAQWEEDEVAFVELEVKYEHGGEVKTQTFTFTPEDNEPKEWDPALIDGKREYKYRWRAGFEGREAGDWSKWEKTTTRNLNVAIETPGKLNVEVTGVGLDFDNILDAVLVHLRYEDRRNDIPLTGKSVLLTAERASGNWTQQLFGPLEKPIEYRVEHLLKSGTMVEENWVKTEGPTENILIPRPDVDVLDLTLIPAGIWTDVIQSVASLRYEDGDYKRDVQFNFTKAEEFKKWAVILKDSNKRKFQYRILATFQNGDTQETDWLEREGDQAVPVKIEGPPRLDVAISGQVADYASTTLIKVDLEYKHPDGEQVIDSYSLAAPTDVHKWSVPLQEGAPRQYRYKVTYYPIEGDPVERDWKVTEDELIVVPRYSIPKVGAEFKAVLQDFTVTPAVEVKVSYDDDARQVHEDASLIFTSKEDQFWFLPVADDAPTEYVFNVIWHYPDGTQKESQEFKSETDRILLPKAPRLEAP